jgi:hypothetical protein
MIPHRPSIEQRITAALDTTPARIPWLIGASGSGRTTTLLRLHETLSGDSQYVDVERSATTPERFLSALETSSRLTPPGARPGEPPGTARAAFDATLAFFERPHGERGATFLLDEVLEFRTFESFPGLRHTLRELVDTLARSRNRFVLSSRYVARARRLLRDAPALFEPIEVPPLSADEVRHVLPGSSEHRVEEEVDELARAVHALAGGRPVYVQALSDGLARLDDAPNDPVGAMTALLMPGGLLSNACLMTYELRLHRARGYGALKAILDVLAREQPLTLTEIAQRLRRTPGSTKDYLTWLEDVDLVTVTQKRYSITDPLLRLWVGLHCRPVPPSLEEVAQAVQQFALARLPRGERQWASAATERPVDVSVPVSTRKSWEIVEID